MIRVHQRIPYGKHVLTQSTLTTYRACPRLYRLRTVEGYREAVDPKATAFGTAAHKATEAWERAPREQRLSAGVSACATMRDPLERLQLTELVRGYHARWDAEPLEYLAVEQQFCVDLVHPDSGEVHPYWVLSGKIDAIVRHTPTGEAFVVERKTKKHGDLSRISDYARRLRMDTQLSVYTVAAQAMGFDPSGCIYDVIAKPGIELLRATPAEKRKWTKPVKATREHPAEPSRLYAGQRLADETHEEYRDRLCEHIAAKPEEYYARWLIARLRDELIEAQRDLWNWADAIQRLEETTIAPRNPDSCHRYGRPCEFLGVCEGGASLDDQEFVHAGRHPELQSA